MGLRPEASCPSQGSAEKNGKSDCHYEKKVRRTINRSHRWHMPVRRLVVLSPSARDSGVLDAVI